MVSIPHFGMILGWTKGRIVDIIGHEAPILSGTQHWTVSQIVQNGQWTLTIPSLNLLWQAITSLQVLEHKSDSWQWSQASSGSFTFASAWDVRREVTHEVEFHNVLWFPTASPKMSACLLRALYASFPPRQDWYNLALLLMQIGFFVMLEVRTYIIYSLTAPMCSG